MYPRATGPRFFGRPPSKLQRPGWTIGGSYAARGPVPSAGPPSKAQSHELCQMAPSGQTPEQAQHSMQSSTRSA